MAGNTELQQKLREGIDAAKAGDALKARRLLSEVVRADGRNELAWIWLATVLTDTNERRLALRRVLDINPNNNRAREALRQLEGGEEENEHPVEPALAARLSATARPTAPTPRPLPEDETPRVSGQGIPPAFYLFIGLALLGVALITFALISGGEGQTVVDTAATETAVAVVSVPTQTNTPENTPLPTATRTPIPADQLTRLAPTLPPTVTPPPSPTPTFTPAFTPTLSLSAFDMIYISQDQTQPQPDAYVLTANGENEGFFAAQMRDVVFAPDAFTIAFVRDIYDENGELLAAEIFTSNTFQPNEVTQITSLGALDTSHPVWTSDGKQLVFSSSGDGTNADLWVVTLGESPRRLLETDTPERAPALSPDQTRIAFTRDAELSGFTEIYLATIDLQAAEIRDVSQATDANRSSYAPVWSPDGRTIVFASDRNGDGDIFVMDADGFNEQVLTLDGSSTEDHSPQFSPDGLWIAFISNAQDGRFQTYLMTARGTDISRLTNNPRNDISVTFKPLLPR